MNTADKPIPIIVVGAERSGTKWLSNILCNHTEVIGAQSELHQGIIETNMFGQMSTKFDLSYDDDYVGLIELWSLTDLFRVTQIEKEYFYSLPDRPTSCIELFRLLMCEFACRNRKSFWLQKTNAHAASKLVHAYTDARFINIKRRMIDTVISTFQNARNQKLNPSLFEATYSYVCHEKRLNRIAKATGAIVITYEELKRDTEATVRKICQELGIVFQQEMLALKFQKNSSFRSESDRHQSLSAFHKLLIRTYYLICHLIPLPAFSLISRVRSFVRLSGPEAFVLGTFRQFSKENDLSSNSTSNDFQQVALDQDHSACVQGEQQ